jgi:hypothetical protein
MRETLSSAASFTAAPSFLNISEAETVPCSMEAASLRMSSPSGRRFVSCSAFRQQSRQDLDRN